jgi:lysosomal Pro-X carboxypeptidase
VLVNKMASLIMAVLLLIPSTVANLPPRLSHPVLPAHSPKVNPTLNWFSQPVDHFSPPPADSPATYQQRYFISDEHYKPGGPMFFYCGNEADVTLYVNATGLIWENAEQFNALVVFGEHRYYGDSHVLGSSDADMANKRFLSVEQALADYASLVLSLRTTYSFPPSASVIAFGGSYGGMLASWGRYKYPHVFDGAIAGSAPIFSFEGMNVNPEFYAEGTTYDVSVKAGAAEQCEPNLRLAFQDLTLVTLAGTAEGVAAIKQGLALCDDNSDDDIGWSATFWLNTALSYMAMGNYPYPSSYILNGNGVLPAFPVRVACDFLDEDLSQDTALWLERLNQFSGVYYNSSGTLQCNELSAPVNEESAIVNELWGYQYCSEIFQLFGQSANDADMFWDAPWNATEQSNYCFDQVGSYPYPQNHVTETWGLEEDWAAATSNIVWSQGEYDPWKGGGVTTNLTESLVSIVIPECAHHVDLFFSDPGDTAAIKNAREFEMSMVRSWIEGRRAAHDATVNENEK